MVQKIYLSFQENINNDNELIVSISWEDYTMNIHYKSDLPNYCNISAPPKSLQEALENWKLSHRILLGDNEAKKELKKRKIRPNSFKLNKQLEKEFNKWLQEEKSLLIEKELNEFLSNNASEIQIVIKTESLLLKQLPWEKWKLLNSYRAGGTVEVILSEPKYKPPNGWKKLQSKVRKEKVRILVILGSQDNDIDVDLDKKIIEQVKTNGAQIKTLEQPSLQELEQNLMNPEGWQIFFFAGHSETLPDGTGVFYLNDNDYEGVNINDLENSFQTAISNGLQLVIFNSCDGLGIANQLTKLYIPQIIVMKEPIGNKMAVDFLEKFLDIFSRDNSLIQSLNQARETLKKYDNAEQYPGSHLLPVLVYNPGVPLKKWKDFLLKYRLSLKWEISLLIIAILAIIGLPISIFFEFPENWLLYLKLYPHVTIYPFIALWAALWFTYQALFQIIDKKPIKVWAIIVLVITSILLVVDLSGSNMMLFELNNNAKTTINISPETRQKLENLPLNIKQKIFRQDINTIKVNKKVLDKTLLSLIKVQNTDKFNEKELEAKKLLMKIGLDFNKAWRKNGYINLSWWSISRCFYALTFFVLGYNLLIFFSFWGWIQNQKYDQRKIYNLSKCLLYITIAQLLIFFWMPFRGYYMNNTKKLIFSFSGSTQSTDLFVWFIIVILFIFSIWNLVFIRKKIWLIYCTFIFFILSISSYFQLFFLGDWYEKVFGINSTEYELIWIIYPVLLFPILFLFQQFDFEK